MPKHFFWIIIIAAGIIGLGAALFYAQPEDHQAMTEAVSGATLDLNLEPLNHDFGTISMKNGLVNKTFKVRNQKTNDIDLSTIFTSCMCTTAKFVIDGQEHGPFGMQGHGATKMLHKKLASGREAELIVTFDPNAHGPSGIGMIERTVSLQSNSGEVATINIKANVTP